MATGKMTPPSELLRPDVRRRLGGLRTSLRGRLLCEGLAWLAVAAVAAVLVTLGLDRAFHFERALRMGLSGAAVVALLYILWRHSLRPLSVPMDIPAMALLVEKRFKQLADRLITTVEFSRRPPDDREGVSPAMISHTGDEANAMASVLNFKDVVERDRMRRVGLLCLSAVLLLAGFTVWQTPVMAMWFQRSVLFAEVDWPQDTYLRVLGGPDFRVVRGDDLVLTVEAQGVVPTVVLLHARYENDETMEVRMDPSPDDPRQFTKKFETVAEGFRFYVSGGDDELDKRREHRVLVVDPPSLREIRFRIEHRAYMDRVPDTGNESTAVIPVTPGSWLHLEANANKPLSAGDANFYLDGKPAGQLRLVDIPGDKPGQAPRGVRADLYLPALNISSSKTLKIVLTAQDGTVNKRGQQFVVQVQPDLPPNVEIRRRVVSSMITPMAIIPVTLAVKDDYGITDANVIIVAKGRTTRSIPVEKIPVRREFQVDQEVDIQPFAYAPGDTIQVYAAVRDDMPEEFTGPPTEAYPNGAPGPNLSLSGMMEFRVVKPEDLMEELVRRLKELRIEFTEAIGLQETARAKSDRALQDAQAGEITATVRLQISDSGKYQTSVGLECAKAAEVMAAILAEMNYNRVGDEKVRSNTDSAIQDLRGLAKPIQDVVAELARQAPSTEAATLAVRLEPIVKEQARIKDEMAGILRKMIEAESRAEAEKELMRLLKASEEILNDINSGITRDTEGLFNKPGPGTQPATTPATPPAPR